MGEAGVEGVVEDGGFPDGGAVAEAAGLGAEGEAEEVGGGGGAGGFYVEPDVAGGGAGVCGLAGEEGPWGSGDC